MLSTKLHSLTSALLKSMIAMKKAVLENSIAYIADTNGWQDVGST